jgi:hypothetical protein
MKKSGATPVKHGVVSRELFHGAKAVQKFADGGGVMGDMSRADMKYEAPKTDELNIKGQKVGAYEGNDEIVKYRMNMTDGVGGKSLLYKDNQDTAPERQLSEDRPYDSIDAIIDAKSSKVSDDPKDKFIANKVSSSKTSSARAPAPKSFAQKANEAKPYDPDATSAGMGSFMAKDLGLVERAADFTAKGDYVSATDIAARDFMKRRQQAKK